MPECALRRARRCSCPRVSRRRARRASSPRPVCCGVTPATGWSAEAWRLPCVIVPVLSSSSTSQSPAASTARPDVAIDVGAHHPAHPGHADRREQSADRRRNQADEQRDQHRDRHRRAGLGDLDAVQRVRQQRDRREQEHERHRDEQDRQRDLVRRLLPLGAFDHADHPVEERFARIDVDADDDPVRQHERAAGHRVEVAARGADHRCALAGDRALVDRGHAFDDLAVAGDEIALLDQHDVALAQVRGRRRRPRGVALRLRELLRDRVLARALERGRLRLAAAFGDRLGEVGEQQRHPEPERDGEDEAGRAPRLSRSAPGSRGSSSGCCRCRRRTSPDCATGSAASAGGSCRRAPSSSRRG